jgi:hypothetical protein
MAGAAFAAGPPDVRWTFETGEGRCAVRHDVTGADGVLAEARLAWNAETGSGLSVTLKEPPPPGGIIYVQVAGTGEMLQDISTRHRIGTLSILQLMKVRENLLAGRALDVVLHYPGRPQRRYSTGVAGVREAFAEFDRCVQSGKMAVQRSAARWSVGTSGTTPTQTLTCALNLSAFDGVEGVDAAFHSIRAGGLRFAADSDPRHYARGGVLRIDLPGANEPWLLDTEVPSRGAEPRAAALLGELAQRRMPRMTYTPRGAQSVPLTITGENWSVAYAMFDACVAAARKPAPKEFVDFTELRYAAEEETASCKLTATYQLQGNVLWLVLASEAGKTVIDATHRRSRTGYMLESLDLRNFGGPRRARTPDTKITLDAARFAEVRRGLVDDGVSFGIVVSATESYTARFGGEFAAVEAAMFEACVGTKFGP